MKSAPPLIMPHGIIVSPVLKICIRCNTVLLSRKKQHFVKPIYNSVIRRPSIESAGASAPPP